MSERQVSPMRSLATGLRRTGLRAIASRTPELRFSQYELMMSVGVMYHVEGGVVKILAERKKGATYDKSLKLPGGHYEPQMDFSLKGTLLREFDEETGKKLQATKLRFIGDESGQWDDKKVYMRVFAQQFEAQTPLHSDEPDIDGYEWVTPEEFKQRSRHTSYRLAIEAWEGQFAH